MFRHQAQRELGYLPDQLFDLAADVERYPEFIPGWIAARTLYRDENAYYTEQIIGFGAFRWRFKSKTLLYKPEKIVVTSSDGILESLQLKWFFNALPKHGCQVRIQAYVELRSKLTQALFNRVMFHSISSVITAFEARARCVLGPEIRLAEEVGGVERSVSRRDL